MTHPGTATRTPSSRIESRRVGWVVLYVLTVLAPFAALGLAWAAFGLVLTFAGGTPPTLAEQELSRRLGLLACGGAVGVPVVGLVCAARSRRRARTAVFATLSVLGIAFAAAVLVIVVAPTWPAPTDPGPAPTSSVCQEHSDGAATCPGG